MDQLKLVALDEQDLQIVSAHVQDAVLKVGEMVFLPGQKRFALAISRFVWEKKQRLFARSDERRLPRSFRQGAVGHAPPASAPERKDDVLELLAIRFQAGDAPAGHVELVFAGGATVRLEVECIEARLADLGPAWQARRPPRPRV